MTNLLKLDGIVEWVAEYGCKVGSGQVDKQELFEELRLVKVLAGRFEILCVEVNDRGQTSEQVTFSFETVRFD